MTRRILALLLCAALVFSLIGCTKEPEPTETTAATQPTETEPTGLTAYNEARAAIDAAYTLTLRSTINRSTTIYGETISSITNQTLHYAGIGTDTLLVSCESNIAYASGYKTTTQEVWADNTLYITMDEAGLFSGPMTAEDCQKRYLPPVLLNADLYGEIILEELESHSTLTFSAPAAAESWALPEGAEFIDASGTALLSAAGELQKLTYTISYADGPATVEEAYETYVVAEPVTISIPDNAADYTQLDNPEIPLMADAAMAALLEANNVTSLNVESILSEAAAFMRNQSTTMNIHGNGNDLVAKFETSVSVMDLSTGESQQLDQEELFVDGKYTFTTDGGEPQPQGGITADVIADYAQELKAGYYIATENWDKITLEELNSGVYYLEFSLTDELAASIEDIVTASLYEDPAFLDDMASAYVTNTCEGYMAIDMVTGMPTSFGYYFEGVHTIEGQDYKMTLQADQSIEAPSESAYYAVTEELLPEEEPETKATPLFYHVTGEDGQEMWLLGTIHVGDARTAYLPQEIYDAFAASDALALEFDSKAFEEQMDTDETLMNQISEAYFYADGTKINDHMDQELYDLALLYLKGSGNFNMNANYMKPYLWSNSLNNFLMRQSRTLHGDKGVESRLETLAADQEKPIYSIESGLFQIQMMCGYSDELQEMLLADALDSSLEEYAQELLDLYEAWCAGDEAALRELLTDDLSEMTEEELALYEEYNKAMLLDRNAEMLKVAIEYLESGEVVFYAVGLAHLLTGNGLVDTLREAGYTVELVSFA